MKKLFISLLSIFMLFSGVAFSACGENDESYSITLESASFDEQRENYIAIDITDMNEDESYEVSVKATVPNQDNGIVDVSSNYNEIVEANSVYNANLNYNTITIKPVSEGTAELIVSARKAPSQKIIVYVYSNVTNISQASDEGTTKKTQYIEFNKDIFLDADRFLSIEARDTCNQKDIVWTLIEDYGESLTIDGEIIRLDEEKFKAFQEGQQETINSVTIRATSKFNEKISTEVSLDVITGMNIESFKYNNSATEEKKDVGQTVELVNTTNTNEKRRELYFYFEIESAYAVSMERLDDDALQKLFGIPNGTLDITLDHYSRNGNMHSFIVKVTSKSLARVGQYDLAFTFVYNNYDYSVSTKTFKIDIIQVVNKIEVTTDAGIVICDSKSNKYGSQIFGDIDIYNQYQDGKGQYFNVDLSPESASNKNFFLRLRVEEALALTTGFAVEDYIQLMTENGLPIEFSSDDTISDGGYVFYKSSSFADGLRFYAVSKTNQVNSSFAIGFYAETDKTVNCFSNLKLQYAPDKNFSLVGDLKNYIETSSNNEKMIEITSNDLTSILPDSLYLSYNQSENFTIGNFEKVGNKITFIVRANTLNFDGKVDIVLKHKNGYQASQVIEVNFFKALTSASVSLTNAYAGNIANSEMAEQSFSKGVALPKLDESLSELVVTFGSSVTLNIRHDANQSFKSISKYYYIVGKGEGEGQVQNYEDLIEFFADFSAKDLFQSPSYFKFKEDDNTLTFNTEENAFVGYIVFDFCGYDENHNEINLYRIIKVESYVPVQSLSTSDEIIERIAEDSLSYNDASNLSSKNVSVFFRRDNNAISYYSVNYAPNNSEHYISFNSVLASSQTGYEFVWFNAERDGLASEKGLKYNGEWVYKIEDVSSTGRSLTFNFVAKTTLNQVEFIDTLVVEYHSYSSTPFRLAIDISVKNSERVESVVWENATLDGEIYLLSRDSEVITEDNRFIIITSVSEAYNRELYYLYINTDGSREIIQFNKNGTNEEIIVQNTSGFGGSGYIYILPQDMIKASNKLIYSYDENEQSKTKDIDVLNLNGIYDSNISETMTWFDYLYENAYFVSNSGNRVPYSNIMIRILLTVADGERETTALRLYNTAMLETIKATKHYVLMNSLTLNNWKRLFEEGEFAGSLTGYNSLVTLTFTGDSESLFDKVGSTAKVQNLIFNGIINNASGFVANENDGIIKDVTVDVYKNDSVYVPSKVYDITKSYVGAIVGTNNGTIDGAKVLGTNLIGGNTVGGIAGSNKGMISNSIVEFYNYSAGPNVFKSDDGYGDSNGNIGGIAGSFESQLAKIENSYVYDYTLTKETTQFNLKGSDVGAFVGTVSNETTDTSISNSFAFVGINKSIGGGNTIGVVLEDYYIGYYDGEEHKNTFSKNDPSRWIITSDADFDEEVNGGKDYLKFHQAKATNIAEVELKESSERFVKVSDNKAILYFYEVDAFTSLTNAQAQELTQLNTYDLEVLFGVNSGIVVDSSNQRVIKSNVASVQILGTGDVTLTVYSKQDFSESKDFTIKVIRIIKDFVAQYKGATTTGFKLQESKNAAVTLTTAKDVYLNGYRFGLILDEIKYFVAKKDASERLATIEWNDVDDNLVAKYTVEGHIATIQSYSGATDALEKVEIVNYLTLNGLDINSDYNKALMGYFNYGLEVLFFEGTNEIGAYYSSIPLDPSTSAYLKVILSTDSDTDNLKISIVDENDISLNLMDSDRNIIVSKTIEESGKEYIFYRTAGEDRIIVKVTREAYDEEDKSFLYTIRLSIADSYKSKISTDERYKIILNAENDADGSLTKYVDLILESQEIQNIDLTNYKVGHAVNVGGNIGYTISSTPISVMAPGARSILEVVVDPAYSYYEEVRLSYSSSDGEILTMTYLRKSGAYYFNVPSAVFSAGALKVNREKGATSYAFGIYVPSNIKKDCVYILTASFWGYQDGQLKELDKNYIPLYISCLSQPRIQVDGEDFTKLAKGASKPVEVIVESNQELESLTIVGEVSGIYLTSNGVQQNENGTKTYNYIISAAVNATGGKFDVKAEVSRVLNGVRETKSMTSSVVLVEFDINSISVKNARENESGLQVFTAYENCAVSFSFEYNYDPIEYNETAENREYVRALTQKRKTFNQVGNYKEDDKYYINYSYLYDEFVEIDIKDQLYLVGSNNREQKLNWNKSALEDIWTYTYYDGINARFTLTYNQSTHKFEILGKSTSSPINLRIKTITYVTSAGKNVYWESNYDFAIQVKTFTDDDSPEEINNASDFLDLDPEREAQGEAKPYILMNDITLVDFKPFDTTLISSFDGNGHTITIQSFAQDEESATLRLALFTNVVSGTTIKNVRVNYYDGGKITVDTSAQGYNNIQIAGFAIENNGIIYNCEVVAFDDNEDGQEHGIIVQYVRGASVYNIDKNSAVDSKVAGFVLTNSGNITNSRVGGTSVWVLDEYGSEQATYDEKELNVFTIKAQGQVSGFVSANSKSIASSFVKNVQITNESTYNGFETAGFVNTNTGKISTSYVEGSDEIEQAHAYCSLSSNIDSIGLIAGFVVTNGQNGYINNCMSNIVISTNSLFGSGFVYKNQGEVIYSYSASQVEMASFTQMGFTGLDKNGNLLSTEGKISYSYYYDMNYDTETSIENSVKTGAELINLSLSNSKSYYYGFSFASGDTEDEMLENSDGIWYMKDDGKISIISADTISHSVRYIAGESRTKTFYFRYSTLTNKETFEETDTTIGRKANPIVIATVEDFDGAMGSSNSTYISAFFNDKEVFGSYRFVDSFNLKDLGVNTEGNVDVASTKKTLTTKYENGKIIGEGQIDGNGFEISNISIVSNAHSSSTNAEQSFGLFAGLRNGAKVFNLLLQIDNVTGDYVYVVGGLAGVVVDSTVVNVSVEQKYNGSDMLESSDDGIKAQNIAGGVVGLVLGNSKIKSVSIKNAIVRTTYYDSERELGEKDADFYINGINLNAIRTSVISGSSNLSILKEFSIAGGIIGFADTYENIAIYNFIYNASATRKFNVSELAVRETVNVRGEVVGGIFGYTSPTTYVQNSSIILSVYPENENYYPKILSFNSYAGAVVGYGQGLFYRVYAEFDADTQEAIEDNFGSYYSGSFDSDNIENRGYTNIFYTSFSGGTAYNYSTQAIGGFAGVMTIGAIENSYSKLNVVAKAESKTIAGGIIGKVMDAGLNYTYMDEPAKDEDDSVVIYVPTTILLSEVYASGDVRGGYVFENDTVYGYAGGIAGQINSFTYLSLVSVNAVNAFRYDDVPVTTNPDTGELEGNLSSVGVQAFVGKNYGNINIIQPKKYTGNGDAEGRSQKSIGYYSHITNASGDIIYINKFDGNVDDRFSTGDFSQPTFEISSISEFIDKIDGYNAVSGAFVKGEHWNVENWIHDESGVYPRIKFISLKSYIFLDRDNVNEVVQKMKNSDITVYVRGFHKGLGTYGDVDLSRYLITGYSGHLIGPYGWLSAEELENGHTARNVIDGSLVGIIVQNAPFSNVKSGFAVSDLTIKYENRVYDDPNNIDGAYSHTDLVIPETEEGLFISGEADGISLINLTFALTKCHGTIKSRNGNAGFIISKLTDSTLTNVVFGLDNSSTITINASPFNNVINAGLLVGMIKDINGKALINGNSVSISETNINPILSINIISSTSATEANIGTLFGKIDGDVDNTNVTTSTFSYGNKQQLIEVNLKSANLGTLNLGAQIGKVQETNTLSSTSGNGNEGFVIIKNADGISANVSVLNYGGITGFVSSVKNALLSEGSSGSNLASTRLIVNADVEKLTAGGMYGVIEGSSETLKIKARSGSNASASFALVTTNTDGQEIGENSRIGGLVGKSEAPIDVESVQAKLMIGLQDGSGVINNTFQKFSAVVGGLVGENASDLTAKNAETTGTIDILRPTSSSVVQNYAGGFVGLMSSDVEITNSLSELNIFSDAQYVGGLVGFVSAGTKLEINNSIYGEKGTLQAYGADAQSIGGLVGFVQTTDSSKAVANINGGIFGGLIYANGDASYKIQNTGDKVVTGDGKTLIVGGIVAEIGDDDHPVNSGIIQNCLTYGDVIVHYGQTKNSTTGAVISSFNNLKTFVFGGIVGKNNGSTVEANFSMMTNNNDRLAFEGLDIDNNANPIVGNNLSGAVQNNSYSHALTLCLDENFGSKDVAYKTAYDTARNPQRAGHSVEGESTFVDKKDAGSDDKTTAIEMAEAILSNVSTFYKTTGDERDPANRSSEKGTKLYPFVLTTDDTGTSPKSYFTGGSEPISVQNTVIPLKNSLHSVVFVTMNGADTKLAQQMKSTYTAEGEVWKLKLAFVGDGFTLSITFDTDANEKPKTRDRGIYADSMIDTMEQNSFISSTVVSAVVNYDVTSSDETKSAGIFANMMTGGIIASSGAYGTLSVGGNLGINLGGIVGRMDSGHILDSYSSIDVTYRAKDDGRVAGFVVTKGEYCFVDNSYSTGKVETYNDTEAYCFIGDVSEGTQTIFVSNCYTISPLVANDHTASSGHTKDKKTYSDSDKIVYKNCWYDPDATRMAAGSLSKLDATGNVTFGAGTDDEITYSCFDSTNISTNYGYPVLSNVGYLARKTQESRLEGDPETTVDYAYIHNARALAKAVKSGTAASLGVEESRYGYILEYDIDLSTTENFTSFASLGNIGYINFDGNNRTIIGLETSLFGELTNSTIKNLRLTDVAITTNSTVGSLATETENSSFDNIVASGSITGNGAGTAHIGGIVGLATNSNFSNCKNYVKVTSEITTANVGGIVGKLSATTELSANNTITNCVNYAPVQNDSTASCSTGGVIGYADGNLEITECGNTNSVLAGYVITDDCCYYAGGIVGALCSSSAFDISIQSCYNTAMVKAGNKSQTNGAYAGGIVGNKFNANLTVSDCLNQGVIEALGSVEGTTTKYSWGSDADRNKLTITYNPGDTDNPNGKVNVYADAFVGSMSAKYMDENQNPTSGCGTNTGTIFKNGLYGYMEFPKAVTFKIIDDTTDKDYYFAIDESTGDPNKPNSNWNNGSWIISNNKIKSNVVASLSEAPGQAVWRMGTKDEATVYISKTDDLGAPTDFYVTVPRTIYYPDTDGTILQIRKQLIYSSYSLHGEDPVETPYYDKAHIYGEDIDSSKLLECMKADSSIAGEEAMYTTIGGEVYSLANNAGQLYKAISTYSKSSSFEHLANSTRINGHLIKDLYGNGYTFKVTEATGTLNGRDITLYPSATYDEKDKLNPNDDVLRVTLGYGIEEDDAGQRPSFEYKIVAEKKVTKTYSGVLFESSVLLEKTLVDGEEKGVIVIYLDNVTMSGYDGDGEEYVYPYFTVKEYKKTSDTSVVPEKTYFTFDGSEYRAVEEPTTSGLSNYYEIFDSRYKKTQDSEIQADKTYYTYDSASGTHSEVITPDIGAIGTYYELIENRYRKTGDIEIDSGKIYYQCFDGKFVKVKNKSVTNLNKYYEVDSDIKEHTLKEILRDGTTYEVTSVSSGITDTMLYDIDRNTLTTYLDSLTTPHVNLSYWKGHKISFDLNQNLTLDQSVEVTGDSLTGDTYIVTMKDDDGNVIVSNTFTEVVVNDASYTIAKDQTVLREIAMEDVSGTEFTFSLSGATIGDQIDDDVKFDKYTYENGTNKSALSALTPTIPDETIHQVTYNKQFTFVVGSIVEDGGIGDTLLENIGKFIYDDDAKTIVDGTASGTIFTGYEWAYDASSLRPYEIDGTTFDSPQGTIELDGKTYFYDFSIEDEEITLSIFYHKKDITISGTTKTIEVYADDKIFIDGTETNDFFLDGDDEAYKLGVDTNEANNCVILRRQIQWKAKYELSSVSIIANEKITADGNKQTDVAIKQTLWEGIYRDTVTYGTADVTPKFSIAENALITTGILTKIDDPTTADKVEYELRKPSTSYAIDYSQNWTYENITVATEKVLVDKKNNTGGAWLELKKAVDVIDLSTNGSNLKATVTFASENGDVEVHFKTMKGTDAICQYKEEVTETTSTSNDTKITKYYEFNVLDSAGSLSYDSGAGTLKGTWDGISNIRWSEKEVLSSYKVQVSNNLGITTELSYDLRSPISGEELSTFETGVTYYEKVGSYYKKTADTTVSPSKTYYVYNAPTENIAINAYVKGNGDTIITDGHQVVSTLYTDVDRDRVDVEGTSPTTVKVTMKTPQNYTYNEGAWDVDTLVFDENGYFYRYETSDGLYIWMSAIDLEIGENSYAKGDVLVGVNGNWIKLGTAGANLTTLTSDDGKIEVKLYGAYDPVSGDLDGMTIDSYDIKVDITSSKDYYSGDFAYATVDGKQKTFVKNVTFNNYELPYSSINDVSYEVVTTGLIIITDDSRKIEATSEKLENNTSVKFDIQGASIDFSYDPGYTAYIFDLNGSKTELGGTSFDEDGSNVIAKSVPADSYNRDVSLSVKYGDQTSSSFSNNGEELTLSLATSGVIISADVDLKTVLYDQGIVSCGLNISGNGHFINFYSINSGLFKAFTKDFVKDVNIAGVAYITEAGAGTVGIFSGTMKGTILNVNTYGSITTNAYKLDDGSVENFGGTKGMTAGGIVGLGGTLTVDPVTGDFNSGKTYYTKLATTYGYTSVSISDNSALSNAISDYGAVYYKRGANEYISISEYKPNVSYYVKLPSSLSDNQFVKVETPIKSEFDKGQYYEVESSISMTGSSSSVNFSSYSDRYTKCFGFSTFEIQSGVANKGTIIGYDGKDGADGTSDDDKYIKFTDSGKAFDDNGIYYTYNSSTGIYTIVSNPTSSEAANYYIKDIINAENGSKAQEYSYSGGVVTSGLYGIGGKGYDTPGGKDSSSGSRTGPAGLSASRGSNGVAGTSKNSTAAQVASKSVSGWGGLQLNKYTVDKDNNYDIKNKKNIDWLIDSDYRLFYLFSERLQLNGGLSKSVRISATTKGTKGNIDYNSDERLYTLHCSKAEHLSWPWRGYGKTSYDQQKEFLYIHAYIHAEWHWDWGNDETWLEHDTFLTFYITEGIVNTNNAVKQDITNGNEELSFTKTHSGTAVTASNYSSLSSYDEYTATPVGYITICVRHPYKGARRDTDPDPHHNSYEYYKSYSSYSAPTFNNETISSTYNDTGISGSLYIYDGERFVISGITGYYLKHYDSWDFNNDCYIYKPNLSD